MRFIHGWRRTALGFLMLILSGGCQNVFACGIRVNGLLGTQGYGYNDELNTKHVWYLQTLQFSVQPEDIPLSFHFSGYHLGDSQDNFSQSEEFLFKKGYFQYGGMGTSTSIRLGRFFLARDVAIGVVDGLEVSQKLHRSVKVTLFGGMMAPLSRKFEFEDPQQATSYGAQLQYILPKHLIFKQSRLTTSYVEQRRREKIFRRRFGLQTIHRFNRFLSWNNTLQLRLQHEIFKKYVSQLRFSSQHFYGMLEGGLSTPDYVDESWYARFDQRYTRLRGIVNGWIIPNKWGAGFEAAALYVETSEGLRMGPVLITPIGELGYRVDYGDRARSDGPWANLHYTPRQGLQIYASGAMVSYEWDELDIKTDDLMMMLAGFRYEPSCWRKLELFSEFQMYQTPQFQQDRRAMAGANWRIEIKNTRNE